MRRALVVPENPPGRFSVQIAETREDLEAAYRLLHDCYVGIGLMDPHPSGLRCTFFSAMPFTTAIVAKDGDQVVGTVSLIRDSSAGLPSDQEFRAYNDGYREQGERLVEVSALAVRPDYRNQHHVVTFLLVKYLYAYAREYMDASMFCAVVHPRAYDFYAALMGYEKNGEPVPYSSVKGAQALHMTVSAGRDRLERLRYSYPSLERSRNFAAFLDSPEPGFVFPRARRECSLDPVMTPELLRHFFMEKTGLFSKLSAAALAQVRSAYEVHFGAEALDQLGCFPAVSSRAFRYPTKIRAVLLSGKEAVFGTIRDLSGGGCFFVTDGKVPRDGQLEVVFNFREATFRIPADFRWETPAGRNARLEAGVGLEFRINHLGLRRALKELHRAASSRKSGAVHEPIRALESGSIEELVAKKVA